LLFGALARDFALSVPQVALCFTAGLATQALWQWGLRLPGRRSWSAYLSAIVTCFGICILVRSQNLWAHPLLACAAMSSKYLLRAGPPACRSHILNPANFAAFAAWAWVPGCWLSPGQWGTDSLTDLWFLALGGLVTQRISRWDVSVTFLVVWASLLAARLLLLDYTWDPGAAMWLQQISNGSTLLFAFFMISDPMTGPSDRRGRIAHAALIAAIAYLWQVRLYHTNGLIWALFIAAVCVPLWDAVWPARKFEWAQNGGGHVSSANPDSRISAVGDRRADARRAA
jgi:enediyne biosynthesis protein E5